MFFFMRAHFRPQSVKTRVNFFDPYLPGVKLPVNDIGTLIIRMTICRQRNARSERDRRIPFRNALSDGARRNERGPAAAGEAGGAEEDRGDSIKPNQPRFRGDQAKRAR